MERNLALIEDDVTKDPCFNFMELKKAKKKNRHYYTRASIHGFHHRYCYKNNCYDPTECFCVRCDNVATRLHVMDCKARGDISLPSFIRLIDDANL